MRLWVERGVDLWDCGFGEGKRREEKRDAGGEEEEEGGFGSRCIEG